LDYVTDEFNVNGLYVIFGFNDGVNGSLTISQTDYASVNASTDGAATATVMNPTA